MLLCYVFLLLCLCILIVYDNEKENWKILTNKEMYAIVKKPTTTETLRLHRLRWFGHVQRKEENRIPKTVLYLGLSKIFWTDTIR
jgi:hypothetical protein